MAICCDDMSPGHQVYIEPDAKLNLCSRVSKESMVWLIRPLPPSPKRATKSRTHTRAKTRKASMKKRTVRRQTGGAGGKVEFEPPQANDCHEPDMPGTVKKPKGTKLLPVSGYEHKYNPCAWEMTLAVQDTHNCYSYVMNDLNPRHTGKAQPGYTNSKIRNLGNPIRCPAVLSRVMADNPQVLPNYPKHKKCPASYYKGALIVDPYEDYHFLRQDPDGFWSHKPGEGKVTRRDAKGQLISDPDKADMLYGKKNATGKCSGLCYTGRCGYFCVPTAYTQTISDQPKNGKVSVNPANNGFRPNRNGQ